jgi:hypothetical protein
MSNPVIYKPPTRNIDKIGDTMFKIGEILDKLDNNNIDISKLKTDLQNYRNILDQYLDRLGNIETTFSAHRDIVCSHTQENINIKKILELNVSKLEVLESGLKGFVDTLSDNIDTNTKTIFSHGEQIGELSTNYINVVSSINDLLNNVRQIENIIPSEEQIINRVNMLPLLQSVECYDDAIRVNKELYINYDLYVRRKSINEFLDNFTDKREYSVDRIELLKKIDDLENRLDKKIENRFSGSRKTENSQPILQISGLELSDGKLTCNKNTIDFKHDLSIKIGESKLTFTECGYLGIGVNNPQYTVDTIGKINCAGGFYDNGKLVKSSPWIFKHGALSYLESPIMVDMLNVNGKLFIKHQLCSSILSTNGDGEVIGLNKIPMDSVEELDKQLDEIRGSLKSLDYSLNNNNTFKRGIKLGDSVQFMGGSLEFRNSVETPIFKISENGEVEFPAIKSENDGHSKNLEIRMGKVVTTNIFKNHNINVHKNSKTMVLNNDILLLDSYKISSKIYIGHNITVDTGMFIINYQSKNTNLHLFDGRLIQYSYRDGIITNLVKNETFVLALLDTGRIIYRNHGDVMWRDLEYLPRVDNVLDIDCAKNYIVVVSKNAGVFMSHDSISWITIKNIVDIAPVFCKTIDENTSFIYGTSIQNGSSVIYMSTNGVSDFIKTRIMGEYLMAGFHKNTLISVYNTFIIATDNGVILILNNLNEWELYSDVFKGNTILDIKYYEDYYYLNIENRGIIKSPDLFDVQSTNYLSQYKSAKFSNFVVYNDSLTVAQQNIIFVLKNKIWSKTVYSNLQNIDALYSYKVYNNYSVLDKTGLDLFPNKIFLFFDQIIISSNDMGNTWHTDIADSVPTYFKRDVLDDTHKYTQFRDYDIEINAVTKTYTLLYKNTKNYKNTVHFKEEYGSLFYFCYPETMVIGSDFTIIGCDTDYVQLVFKKLDS